MIQQFKADFAVYLGEEYRSVFVVTTNGTELAFRITASDRDKKCVEPSADGKSLVWSGEATGDTPKKGNLPLAEIDSIEIWAGNAGNEQITWTRVGNTLARVPSSIPIS